MTGVAYEAEQEVRFAVVMYGGVSLAIYINGVAQELFRLVQATAPAIAADGETTAIAHHPDSGDGALQGSAVVYRALGRWLGVTGPRGPEPPAGDSSAPIRTRFVVDVLSGTSAGGINGILLAKALVNASDFGPSRRLWIEVAGIAALLRGLRDPLRSLLDGNRLYAEARKVLAVLGRRDTAGAGDDAARRSAYVEQLDLAVTTTDLEGLPLTLPLRFGDGSQITEPQHRKVLVFSCGTVGTSGADHSDFGRDADRLLAFAGRATSAFPFAFEPVALAALPPHDGDPSDDELRDRLFAELRDSGVRPEAVWFADGGYLDNKPFTYATRALRRRHADLPVTRRLLYVEPDPAPAQKPADAYDGRPPNLYRNTLAATVGLRGFEPIRQDLADVAERNGQVARLREIERDAAAALIDGDAEPGDAERQVGYGAYRSLRLRTTLDRLAQDAATLAGQAPDADGARLAREALRAWSGPLREPDRADALVTLLAELDVAYQHRRVSFLHDRLNELLRRARPPQFEAFAAACGVDPGRVEDDVDGLREVKRQLNGALELLRRAEWALGRPPRDAAGDDAVLARLRTVAAQIVTAAGAGAADDYVQAMRDHLRWALQQAGIKIHAALGGSFAQRPVRELMLAYDRRFELFDLVVAPLAFPGLGEVNAVDVWRVSPLDADGLRVPAADKLAGTRLAHFGGFLDEGWRRGDLLWGRLDGAEAILEAVLPGAEHEVARGHLRVRAQAAILREELGLEGTDDAVVEAFAAGWRAPASLDGKQQARLLLAVIPRAVVTLVRGLKPGPRV